MKRQQQYTNIAARKSHPLNFERYERYESLILRVFLGLTLIFWGYEKLTLPKLASSYLKDYGSLLIFDVRVFLIVAGVAQLLLGIAMILGCYTRLCAALLALMAIITIVIPGMIIIRDLPHFAYAFATTGGALALIIRGSGVYSLDKKLRRRRV